MFAELGSVRVWTGRQEIFWAAAAMAARSSLRVVDQFPAGQRRCCPGVGTFAPKPRAEGRQSVPEAARARRTLRPAESQDESPVF